MKLEQIDLMFGDARKNTVEIPKSINTTITITDAKISDDLLVIDFEYAVTYIPDGSHIRIGGHAIFSGSESKKGLDEWSKTRNITGPHGEFILNSINYTSSINAVLLSRAFNLMPPVMLPTLTFGGAPTPKPVDKIRKK